LLSIILYASIFHALLKRYKRRCNLKFLQFKTLHCLEKELQNGLFLVRLMSQEFMAVKIVPLKLELTNRHI
jgi:hypothetical protein